MMARAFFLTRQDQQKEVKKIGLDRWQPAHEAWMSVIERLTPRHKAWMSVIERLFRGHEATMRVIEGCFPGHEAMMRVIGRCFPGREAMMRVIEGCFRGHEARLRIIEGCFPVYFGARDGSAEVARKVAELVVRPPADAKLEAPPRSILILRCLIPRTFIDSRRAGAGGPARNAQRSLYRKKS